VSRPGIDGVRRHPEEGLSVGRAAALCLLGLHAVTSALLAWNPERLRDPALVAALVLLLAGAQAGGLALAGRLADFPERRRLRVVGVTSYAGLVGAGLLALLGSADPRLLAREVELLSGVQVFLALASGLSRGDLGALQNSLLLVSLAGLRGGAVAGVAVTGWLVLVVFFLAFDHFARQVAAYPVERVELVGVAFRAALARGILVAAPLAVVFMLAPPTPYGRLLLHVTAREFSEGELAEAYARLLVLALLAVGLLWLVGRLVRRRREREPVAEERVPVARAADEPLDDSSVTRPRYAGLRGRIVRAYVGFLSEAQRLGFRRMPSQTAWEFAGQLPGPSTAVRRLTELFVAARYGPGEPTQGDAQAADRAAQAALADLRTSRAGRRGLTTGRPAA
jgi:hypothetical protein